MQAKLNSRQNQRRLFDLAESQGGYFTSRQAGELGYSANKRNYHVAAGNWIREAHGIYRLALFPRPERPDLLLWWLWSRNRSGIPLGVYGHRTALSLHDLTDVMPAKIDMIVPNGFRRGSPIPGVLNLHFSSLRPEEIERIDRIPVTTALRALCDVWHSQELPRETLRSAFEEAMRIGKITNRQILAASRNPESKRVIADMLGQERGS